MMSLSKTERKTILAQCRNQGAESPEQVMGFTEAFLFARTRDDQFLWPFGFQQLAWLIEPVKARDYRKVPVVFRNGKSGIPWDQIPRALDLLADAMDRRAISALEAYVEFERIHPFEDGNGRVGHLVWAIYSRVLHAEWPEDLPPQVDWDR